MTKNTEHKSNTPANIKDLWRTPQYVFDYFDKRFDFQNDMASSDKNFLCDNFFTESKSAFDADITDYANGSTFCNPPYSKIFPWVNECIIKSGLLNQAFVMLLPADTSVKWFRTAFRNCSECHFISGRLAFINEETLQPVAGNNKGSVVFVFDPKSPFKQQVSMIDRDEMRVD